MGAGKCDCRFASDILFYAMLEVANADDVEQHFDSLNVCINSLNKSYNNQRNSSAEKMKCALWPMQNAIFYLIYAKVRVNV